MYVERYVKVAPQATFDSEVQSATSYRAVNYALRCEMNIDENVVSDDIIGAGIDIASRSRRQREVTGTLEAQLINPGFFRYFLGLVSTSTVGAGQYYHKFTVANSCPCFTIEKGLREPTEIARYFGTKINIFRLTLEKNEDITQELTLVAKDVTFATGNYSSVGVDINIPVFTYFDGQVKWSNTVIAGVQSTTIEGNRNLEARMSADYSQSRPRTPRSFREGYLDISGRVRIDEATSKFIQAVFNNDSLTLSMECFKASWNKMLITINNVSINEAPDEVTGREPYELDFPFSASGTGTGANVMQVEWWTSYPSLDDAGYKY